ncbi:MULTISPECIES: hypothetical protein [unclassified Tenacibaculum]|uniref:HD domain-containing protein n=1 Tax=unclassified Tenacibaculum TaxID=2635139 RepID=UPI001F28C7DE|nr:MULTISPECIES: hypothetical protein [unclassified Tenacibaculum]MCF2875736.1 hypothetical protein [Tenacibaculum sp. Cn5-1]MCF2935812.1 hypothetical protein [Tenacibaculum sp. Cn5-34]MCG7512372.1 hypothetical protein [Tenacibaculum sp. Cn5-46]
MNLEQRFSELISNYTNDATIKELLWKEIITNYSEKHRAYHNLTHLKEIFNYVDTYNNQIENIDIVSFSVFYHDIIYNIWKKDNEEKSAVFALDCLSKIDLSSNNLDAIHKQIIATKTHEANDSDTKWLIDFDLGILGTSSDIYSKYTKLIRKEYKSVPNFLYKKGRKKVLQHFINKPFIYATATFRDLYEEQARTNLKNELNSL